MDRSNVDIIDLLNLRSKQSRIASPTAWPDDAVGFVEGIWRIFVDKRRDANPHDSEVIVVLCIEEKDGRRCRGESLKSLFASLGEARRRVYLLFR